MLELIRKSLVAGLGAGVITKVIKQQLADLELRLAALESRENQGGLPEMRAS
jgi:hypothetical protein